MHGVQLHLSFDSINLQFFEYAFLNESSVTSWVEHCINHLSSFGVVMCYIRTGTSIEFVMVLVVSVALQVLVQLLVALVE